MVPRIEQAIEKGAAWLKTKQLPDGSWGIGNNPTYGGAGTAYEPRNGIAALVLFALLKSDVHPTDPVITKGFAFLEKQGAVPTHTYESSVMILAYDALAQGRIQATAKAKIKQPARRRAFIKKSRQQSGKWLSKKERAQIKRLVDFLVVNQSARGGWRYGPNMSDVGHSEDVSSTQFVLLGLMAGSRLGLQNKQHEKVFLKTLGFLHSAQEKDGPALAAQAVGGTGGGSEKSFVVREGDKARGFPYIPGAPEKDGKVVGSMTAAGTVSLILCKAVLKRNVRYRKTLAARTDRGIFDGLAWLDHHWTVDQNPGIGHNRVYYYLYGLERVGVLGSVEFIGKHHWYAEGAGVLVNAQEADGHWNTHTEVEPTDIIDTCYALLFLKKATIPVGVAVTRD
jgi:hypothetical protein